MLIGRQLGNQAVFTASRIVHTFLPTVSGPSEAYQFNVQPGPFMHAPWRPGPHTILL